MSELFSVLELFIFARREPSSNCCFSVLSVKKWKKKKVHIYAYARLVRQEAFEFSTGRTTYLLPNGTSSEMEEESENEVKGRLAI